MAVYRDMEWDLLTLLDGEPLNFTSSEDIRSSPMPAHLSRIFLVVERALLLALANREDTMFIKPKFRFVPGFVIFVFGLLLLLSGGVGGI
jgi:hypothetical protein